MMGWTYVKVLLTSLNCHAATSGFHQGLWEWQVSRTEWCSEAFNQQQSTHVCFLHTGSTRTTPNGGRDTAGEVTASLDVQADSGHGPHTRESEPRTGWDERAESCSILTPCRCVCGGQWCEGTPSAAPRGSSSRKTDLQRGQEQPVSLSGAAGAQEGAEASL